MKFVRAVIVNASLENKIRKEVNKYELTIFQVEDKIAVELK